MKKTLSLAAILAAAAVLIPSARAGEQTLRYQPEPDFELVVGEALIPFEAKDAFLGLSACAILDAKTIRRWTLAEAEEIIGPCLKEVSAHYVVPVAAQAGIVGEVGNTREPILGLVLRIPKEIVLGSPLLRDLNHSLALRNGYLLGYPAVVRRWPGEDLAARSALQDAIDRCILPMVVRKIESGEDFIRYYGRCITRDQKLKVREIRPLSSRQLAVTVLSAADQSTVESLNGIVSVQAEKGPVDVLVLAYPENFFLP